MPVEMPDISLISDSESIFAPVQRAQEYKQQQNALARQQAVRNALAANYDPVTRQTNWQNAFAMAGQDAAPELQGMQQEDATRLTKEDTDYLTNMRGQLEMYVNDQPSYNAWVAKVKERHPYASFPPEFSPEVKNELSGFSRKLEMAGRTGSYNTLTPEEEQALGLPSNVVAQRDPRGKVNVVYKPPAPGSSGATADLSKFPLLAQAIAAKRVPLSRVNGRTAAIYEQALRVDPNVNLSDINLEQTRQTSGARTGGVTQQNLEMAGQEARGMINVARNAAADLDLSDFKTLNQLTRWLGGQLGNPKYAALNTAINSLINSYARAINPRGVPTVSDKQHAREILDSAMAKGNLEAAFTMMETEIDTAHEAAKVGPGGTTPTSRQQSGPPAGVPANVWAVMTPEERKLWQK